MPIPKIRIPPALALFLLSPIVGELLSGSSPPSEFFTPFGFTIMSLLYGGGALTVREIKVRWNKGMGSLLLLGAAYGVLEEGLMVASFFNPAWPDLGVLGVFGRWLGVNWVWAVELTAYHAIVSITVPVILVELTYPNFKGKAWLRGAWEKIVPLLLGVDVIMGFILFGLFQSYWPPIPQYLFMILLTIFFVVLALKLPSDWARHGKKPIKRPGYYWFVIALGAFFCGIIFWVLPNILNFTMAPILVIIFGLLLITGLVGLLISYDWTHSNPLHRFSIAAGALTPLIISAFFQEFDKSRPDNTSGMALVGLTFLVGLLILRKRLVKSRSEKNLT